MKEFKPIKPFNDHPNCKGHANYFLDCDYTNKQDRDLITRCLDKRIANYEKNAI